MTQYDGWLAAQHLTLPTCQNVTAIAEELSSHIVNIDIRIRLGEEKTKCSPQNRYENFTLVRSGWELAPVSM